MARNVLMLSQKVANHNPALGEGFTLAAHNMDPGGHLAELVIELLGGERARAGRVPAEEAEVENEENRPAEGCEVHVFSC